MRIKNKKAVMAEDTHLGSLEMVRRLLGAIHKLRHTLREWEGVDEVRHCVTRGGGPKICDITFQK